MDGSKAETDNGFGQFCDDLDMISLSPVENIAIYSLL